MIVAVTGTKGKTTISCLLHHCLNYLNEHVISHTTLGFRRNSDEIRVPRSVLQHLVSFIQASADNKIFEATSYCLELSYFDNLEADSVIFTGIEEAEHTEIHHTFERYIAAKRQIFKSRSEFAPAFVCRDDKNYDKITKSVDNVISYGFSKNADHKLSVIELSSSHMIISINDHVKIKTKLLGPHNAQNVCAAYLVLREHGFAHDKIVAAIENFCGVQGRFERFEIKPINKIAIIDYAHTPRSLKSNLQLIRKVYPEKNICTVFGCGGNKAIEKRPLMGSIASTYSDEIIVTNDNPRMEDETKIAHEISIGIQKEFMTILDRKSAIEAAMKCDSKIILLAGKGSEDYYIDKEGYHQNMSDRKLLTDVCEENKFTIFAI